MLGRLQRIKKIKLIIELLTIKRFIKCKMLADMRLQYNMYHDIISSYHSDYKIYEGDTDNVPTLTKTINL